MCSEPGQPVRRCVRVTRWEAVAEWPRECVVAVTEVEALAVPAVAVPAADSEEDSAAEGLKRSAYSWLGA